MDHFIFVSCRTYIFTMFVGLIAILTVLFISSSWVLDIVDNSRQSLNSGHTGVCDLDGPSVFASSTLVLLSSGSLSGERKGVNKYYPPDFNYKKHGSLDKYHNSHPLRERAKKIGEGILIIRFEMPYNIWCNGCNKHIGMGVRYNSEKIKVGNYYSTPIYKFKMKCHLCDQYFEIQTDPANCEYVIMSGARRKEERWNAKDNEQIEMTDHLDKKKLATDAMFKLEHNVKDERKLAKALPTLEEIQEIQEEKRDDYILNKVLRKKFRDKKKALEATAKRDQALLDKSSLDINLVAENLQDKNLAKLLSFDTVKSFEESEKERRRNISSAPVLKPTSTKEGKDNFTAKLPKTLGSVLSKSLTKPDLWGRSPVTKLGKRLGSKISALNILGVKVARKSSCEKTSSPTNTSKPLSPVCTLLKDDSFETDQKSRNPIRTNLTSPQSTCSTVNVDSVGLQRTLSGPLVECYSSSSSSDDEGSLSNDEVVS